MPNQPKVGEEREIWGKRKRKLWEIGPINVKNVKNQSCGDFEKLTVDAKKKWCPARGSPVVAFCQSVTNSVTFLSRTVNFDLRPNRACNRFEIF